MFQVFLIHNVQRPLTQEDINKAEVLVGGKMPPEYWMWMKLYNGGRPERAVFNIPSEKGGVYSDSFVNWFYSVSEDRSLNFLTKNKLYIIQPRFEKGLIAVAEDGFGNMVLLSIREKDYGQVFFWDHEKEEEEAVAFVAKNWVEFINSLQTRK